MHGRIGVQMASSARGNLSLQSSQHLAMRPSALSRSSYVAIVDALNPPLSRPGLLSNTIVHQYWQLNM